MRTQQAMVQHVALTLYYNVLWKLHECKITVAICIALSEVKNICEHQHLNLFATSTSLSYTIIHYIIIHRFHGISQLDAYVPAVL